MKAWVIGLGALALLGGGIAIAKQLSVSGVVMHRGKFYAFQIDKRFNGNTDDLAAAGFASITSQEIVKNELYAIQAVWAGQDGIHFINPTGMSEPQLIPNQPGV